MKNFIKTLLAGVAVGTTAVVVGRLLRRQVRRPFVRTTEDLSYSALSPEMLESRHLVDLNSADISRLAQLGLNQEMAERVIENRPFRNKLELLSRRVLAEEMYEEIKDKVAVANANEPVKIA